MEDAVSAWKYTIRHLAETQVRQLTAVIFDKRCKLTSSTAMTGGSSRWGSAVHDGLVPLPGGKSMPAQVTSFAAPAGDSAFFVMAAPSVWREGGVRAGELKLEQLMTAVLLHEGIHVLQFSTYGRRMDALATRHQLPDSFNDDSIQKQFEANQDFASSVARETELLFAASATADTTQARKLAREARALMLARQERWFRGKNAYLREAEEIWLTMEGSGQWIAYRWLTDPQGGGVPTGVAMPAFALRGKSWSQKQGIALFLVLERLQPSGWKARVFGGDQDSATKLLDDALQPGA